MTKEHQRSGKLQVTKISAPIGTSKQVQGGVYHPKAPYINCPQNGVNTSFQTFVNIIYLGFKTVT